MVFLTRLLWILFLLLVARLLFRFVGGLLQGLRGGDRGTTGARARFRGADRAVPLVRDPVCGTYVVKGRALTSVADGSTHYFCSEACRHQFERSRVASRPA